MRCSRVLPPKPTSNAVIAWFHFDPANRDKAHWFKTFLALLIGGLAMLYVVYLLWINMGFVAGNAVNSLLYQLIPYIALASFLPGADIVPYFKYLATDKYQVIGRIVMDEQRHV